MTVSQLWNGSNNNGILLIALWWGLNEIITNCAGNSGKKPITMIEGWELVTSTFHYKFLDTEFLTCSFTTKIWRNNTYKNIILYMHKHY